MSVSQNNTGATEKLIVITLDTLRNTQFSVSQLATHLEMTEHSVRSALRRLYRRNLVCKSLSRPVLWMSTSAMRSVPK